MHAAIRTDGYDSAKPKDFYSHLIIEVIANTCIPKPDEWWAKDMLYPYKHPRTGKQFLNTHKPGYPYRYEYMTVMYGSDVYERKPKRSVRLFAPLTSKDEYSYSNNKYVYFVPVPMPKKGELLWIDTTYPLRGIYIPVSHTYSPKWTDRARYYGLLLRQLDMVIHQPDKNPPTGSTWRFPRNDADGWSNDSPMITVAMDIERIAARLSLPDHVVGNEFQDITVLMRCFDAQNVECKTVEKTIDITKSGRLLSKVISVTYGIQMKEAGEPDKWLSDVITAVASAGLACIPVIGPIAAVVGGFALSMLLNPEEFCAQNETLKSIPDLVGALLETSKLAKPFIKKELLKKMTKIVEKNSDAVKSASKLSKQLTVADEAQKKKEAELENKKLEEEINEPTKRAKTTQAAPIIAATSFVPDNDQQQISAEDKAQLDFVKSLLDFLLPPDIVKMELNGELTEEFGERWSLEEAAQPQSAQEVWDLWDDEDCLQEECADSETTQDGDSDDGDSDDGGDDVRDGDVRDDDDGDNDDGDSDDGDSDDGGDDVRDGDVRDDDDGDNDDGDSDDGGSDDGDDDVRDDDDGDNDDGDSDDGGSDDGGSDDGDSDDGGDDVRDDDDGDNDDGDNDDGDSDDGDSDDGDSDDGDNVREVK